MTNLVLMIIMLMVFVLGYYVTDLFMTFIDENCRGIGNRRHRKR